VHKYRTLQIRHPSHSVPAGTSESASHWCDSPLVAIVVGPRPAFSLCILGFSLDIRYARVQVVYLPDRFASNPRAKKSTSRTRMRNKTDLESDRPLYTKTRCKFCNMRNACMLCCRVLDFAHSPSQLLESPLHCRIWLPVA